MNDESSSGTASDEMDQDINPMLTDDTSDTEPVPDNSVIPHSSLEDLTASRTSLDTDDTSTVDDMDLSQEEMDGPRCRSSSAAKPASIFSYPKPEPPAARLSSVASATLAAPIAAPFPPLAQRVKSSLPTSAGAVR
jgi:hypothetical protein